MLDINTERLAAFDEIFQKTPKMYFVELKADTFYSKEYAIKVLKDNEEEIAVLGEKVNAILQDSEISESDKRKRFMIVSDEMNALTEEKEEKGKVIAKQYKGYLSIEFYAEDELVKEFNAKNDEYMDDVFIFLKDEYKKYLYNF